MVLGCSAPAPKVGDQRMGIYDGEMEYHAVPYVVLREATRQEWEDYCRSQGYEPAWAGSMDDVTFWYVSTD